MKRCARCGAMSSDFSQKCETCGAKLPRAAQEIAERGAELAEGRTKARVKALVREALNESAETAALSVTHAPIGKGGRNWITASKPGNTGQIPAYIQNVRNAIMRGGVDESKATAIAVGRVRDWAEGKGGVHAEVRAAAAKAIAEWDAMRAASHARTAAKG